MTTLNNTQFLVGLDPSFTRTGICVINLISKEISFFTASEKIGEKQFENIVRAAKSVVKQIKGVIDDNYCIDKCTIVMESPLPNSSMSAALYCLDSLLYTALEPHVVETYNPATLRSKIHHCKYTKSDSVNLADKYISELSKNGYQIVSAIGSKRKIPHDNAEAFLYCHLYLYNNGHPDFQFNNSEDVSKRKLRQLELKRREKLLLSDK